MPVSGVNNFGSVFHAAAVDVSPFLQDAGSKMTRKEAKDKIIEMLKEKESNNSKNYWFNFRWENRKNEIKSGNFNLSLEDAQYLAKSLGESFADRSDFARTEIDGTAGRFGLPSTKVYYDAHINIETYLTNLKNRGVIRD